MNFIAKFQLPMMFVVDISCSMIGQGIMQLNSLLMELNNLLGSIAGEI